MPKGALDQWVAFDSVEPIGEEWRQTAETNFLLRQLIGIQMAKAGVKSDQFTVNDCMPARYDRPKRKVAKPKSDTNQMFKSLIGAFGLSKVANGNNDNAS
jgi:hypothetical protein